MREIRYAAVNGKEIPVLISDENEALLAARAAGGAIVGLWSGEGRGTAAPYAVEALSDVTEEFLERLQDAIWDFPGGSARPGGFWCGR